MVSGTMLPIPLPNTDQVTGEPSGRGHVAPGSNHNDPLEINHGYYRTYHAKLPHPMGGRV